MAWISVVTNAGQALLASYGQGGHTLTLLGATVGSGTVSDANLRLQTAVASEKDNASIISAETITGGVKYKIQVGPTSLDNSYVAHQIGIWAKLDNGSSTLLILAQDSGTGVNVPTAASSPAFAFALYVALNVDNTDDLNVTIDTSAYVTTGTLQAGLDLKVNVADVANDLTTTTAGKVLDARQGKALDDKITAVSCLTISCGTISSLPKTVSNAAITADMVVLEATLGTPSAQTGDWTVTTAAGSLTITGTISGSTTLTLVLAKSR